MSIKVIVNLPDEDITFLRHIAAKERLTFTDVLSRSIATEKFLIEQGLLGRKILIESVDGMLREVIRN